MDRNAPMTIPPEPPHDVACSQGQNRCSDPCRRSYWLRCGERKPKAIVWQIFRERYPKQVLYFVKVKTNGKLETRTKGIVDKCSDRTCTKKYALTEGPKGGNLMWATRSAPPPRSFYARYGPEEHYPSKGSSKGEGTPATAQSKERAFLTVL